MHKSQLKLLGLAVALALSTSASALGLGGINVVSALGQPLKADIELVAVGKSERAGLVAKLASAEAYKGAGLEYPQGSKFKFQVDQRADGSVYIRVSSAQPVNDPFVSLLVELTWSSGRMLREYTFLLDPPDYVAEQPAPAEVAAVAPEVMAPVAQPQVEMQPKVERDSVETLKQQPETMRADAPGDATALARKPVMSATQSKPVSGGMLAKDIVVHSGDTLAKIATVNKPVDVSLERMLVALYRANAGQFDGHNMNRIKTGKILRMPEQNDLMGVSQSEAIKEIRAQAADWNSYRQKLASAAPLSTQSQEARQVSSGSITSSVTDKTPVAKESAKEVLKLSKGEAPGDQTAAGGKTMSPQDRKNAAQEEAIAKAKAVEEEKARLAMLEQNIKDMQRLAELKTAAAALTQSGVAASEVVAVSSVAAASEVAAASAPVAKPKPKRAPQPQAAPPEPSLVDEVLGQPLYLGGLAALLAALGGLGYLLKKRRESSDASMSSGSHEPVGDITARLATPPEPSPDNGDFTSLAATDETVVAPPEDVDPISEADLFLNFGRDAQAEEVLKEALQRTPDDHRIHLKLLGIYANRVDVNSFANIARQLQASGDLDAWEQAAAMGRKLEPGNPMYGGGSIEEVENATMMIPPQPEPAAATAAAPELDFDLGLGATPEEIGEKAEETEIAMDFDLTDTTPSPAMDFDVTSTSPLAAVTPDIAEEPADAGLPNLDDLVFDITSMHPAVPLEEPVAPKPEEAHDEDVMEFALDFPIEETPKLAVESTTSVADLGLSEISLNLDDIGTMANIEEPAVKDEHWHEVATKLDLARAYQEMGDQTGAREILEEVLRDGDEGQREAAQTLISQLI